MSQLFPRFYDSANGSRLNCASIAVIHASSSAVLFPRGGNVVRGRRFAHHRALTSPGMTDASKSLKLFKLDGSLRGIITEADLLLPKELLLVKITFTVK